MITAPSCQAAKGTLKARERLGNAVCKTFGAIVKPERFPLKFQWLWWGIV